MPTADLFFNSKFLDEVETSAVTPGAQERQAIGRGRSIPGRAAPATISIALTPQVRTAILTAQHGDQVVIITAEDRATYRLVGWKLDDAGNVLHAALEFLGVAPAPDLESSDKP